MSSTVTKRRMEVCPSVSCKMIRTSNSSSSLSSVSVASTASGWDSDDSAGPNRKRIYPSRNSSFNIHNAAQSSSSLRVNRLFASVYIDKDFHNLKNASFECSDVTNGRMDDCSITSNSLKKTLSMQGPHKKVRALSRKKFYKWAWTSNCDLASTSMSQKLKNQRSSSKQIASRLGLVHR